MPEKKHYTDAEKAPLTPEENAQLRQILKDDEFQRRFWSTVRIWTVWIGGVVGTAYYLRGYISDAFKRFFS